MSNTPRRVSSLSRRDLLLGAVACVSLPAVLPASAAAEPTKPNPARSRFVMERFVEDCVKAGKEDRAQDAVKEVLSRAMDDPRAVLLAIGEPTQAGLTVFHRSATLTIFAAAWTPQMNLMPHNHRMWATIGIYTGREDNILWRRSEEGVTAYGAAALFEKDVVALPDTAIHSVTNPLERFTGGIHIYGGDFFATTRSQWDPETREEQPSDGAVIRRMFERANQRMHCVDGT